MPLSESHSAMRAKLDSTQSKPGNSLSDLPFSTSDDDFMELLWENGQIVMQGQSSRSKNNTSAGAFTSQSVKVPEKEETDAVAPRTEHFGAADSIRDDFSVAEVSDHINAQDDEMVPWLNLPIDDYCLRFLSEFSAPNMNSPIDYDSPLPTDGGNNGSGHLVIDSHNAGSHELPKSFSGSSNPGGIRSWHSSHLIHQLPSSSLGSKSRALSLGTGNTGNMSFNTSWDDKLNNGDTLKQELLSSKQTAPPPPPMSSSAGLMNFSHFSRPIALVKTNLESAERLKSNGKASICGNSNHLESTLIETASDMKSISQIKMHQVSGKKECKLNSDILQENASIHLEAIIRENDSGKHDSPSSNRNRTVTDSMDKHNLSFKLTVPIAGPEAEKAFEPAVASSSVCSGSGAGTASNDTKYRAKRKIKGEDSSYHCENPEDGSTGVKKHGIGQRSSAKRSRAAEVHNLSERRRRDRINEKMRALQELIPNCNKVDKASMLDEAIEYLKILQLQVQIMSTGNGLCVSPMMSPTQMQQIRVPHMVHFPSIGLGMGMGYEMGMLNVNGSPLILPPVMHGAQFPCSSSASMPKSTTNLSMYGIPSQGIPRSMPRESRLSPKPGQSTRMNTVPEISSAITIPVQVSETTVLVDSKEEQIQGSN